MDITNKTVQHVTSNATMQEIERVLVRELSKRNFGYLDLTPAHFFPLGSIKGQTEQQ